MSGYNLGAHDMVLEETDRARFIAWSNRAAKATDMPVSCLPRLPEKIDGAPSGEEAMAALGLQPGDMGFGEALSLVGGCGGEFYPGARS